ATWATAPSRRTAPGWRTTSRGWASWGTDLACRRGPTPPDRQLHTDSATRAVGQPWPAVVAGPSAARRKRDERGAARGAGGAARGRDAAARGRERADEGAVFAQRGGHAARRARRLPAGLGADRPALRQHRRPVSRRAGDTRAPGRRGQRRPGLRGERRA